jgi:hypothetical protein
MTRENATAYGLGTVGAVAGAWNYYAKPELHRLRPSTKAWIGLASYVLAYDLTCPKGETLSEAAHRAKERNRVVTSAVIGTTALHLAHLLPQEVDPFHRALKLVKR